MPSAENNKLKQRFPNQFFFAYCSYFYLTKYAKTKIPSQDLNGGIHSLHSLQVQVCQHSVSLGNETLNLLKSGAPEKLHVSEVLCSLLTVQPKTEEFSQPHFLLLPPP